MDEIREAVSIVPNRYEMDEMDLPEGRTLIEVCGGLVVTDNQTGSIRLAHYTVQEYLLKKSSLILKPEAELAIACVTYLSFDVFSGTSFEPRQFFQYSSEMALSHLRSSDQKLTFEPFLHFVGKPNNISFFCRI